MRESGLDQLRVQSEIYAPARKGISISESEKSCRKRARNGFMPQLPCTMLQVCKLIIVRLQGQDCARG